MKNFAKLAIAASLVVGAAPALAANEGFDTGDTSGWTSSGPTGASAANVDFAPIDGSFFGFAAAGAGDGVYATLSQSFNLSKGNRISGWFGFKAADYLPFNDDGYVSVNGTNVLAASVGSVGNYGKLKWTPFVYHATATGSYTLELGARNIGDNSVNSYAVLDAVNAGVPEPAQWALMLGGFGLIGSTMRRRRTTTVYA